MQLKVPRRVRFGGAVPLVCSAKDGRLEETMGQGSSGRMSENDPLCRLTAVDSTAEAERKGTLSHIHTLWRHRPPGNNVTLASTGVFLVLAVGEGCFLFYRRGNYQRKRSRQHMRNLREEEMEIHTPGKEK